MASVGVTSVVVATAAAGAGVLEMIPEAMSLLSRSLTSTCGAA